MNLMTHVQRWRQRQRQAAHAALTLWLPLDVKNALEAQARQRHCAPADLVQQALITCYAARAGEPDTAAGAPPAMLLTETAEIRRIIQEELRALLRESPLIDTVQVRHIIQEELRALLRERPPPPQGHAAPPVLETAPEPLAAAPVPWPVPASVPDLPGIPPFDPTKHRLGKLCKQGHAWGTSGRSLKPIAQGGCLVCAAKRTRKRRRDTRHGA